ncbi:hypothetical protein [Ruminococcus gauvreauii]|uniref:hypothetical protein n=1 Tax=Ruminococcus gauvreauii TaxID=438033 RepID=UPI003983EBB7
MGQILQKINLWVRRHREITAAAVGLLVVVLFSVSVCGTLSTQASAAMENPIQGISDQSSFVQLSGTTEVVAEAPKGMALTAENDMDASDQPTAEDQQANESKANTGNHASSANSLSSGSGQESGGSQASDGDGGNSSDKDKDDKNLGDEGIKKGEYFTTSIQNNEVAYESHYTYTIMHKHEELKVLQVQNKVNEGKFTNYTGEIVLAEGENQITVKATYRGTDGKTFSAVKSYTIYYEKNKENVEKARIETSLANSQETPENEFSFSAVATLGGKQTELTINVERADGTTESSVSMEDNHTVRELSEGSNKVTLSAGKGSAKTTKSYVIIYEPESEAGNVRIDSDLKDQNNTTVNRRKFSFYATGFIDSTQIPVQVLWNGQELEDPGGGSYDISLEMGNNEFLLQALNGNGEIIKEEGPYVIAYAPKEPSDDNGDGPVSDEGGPTIYCSLSEVSVVSNDLLNFTVVAIDQNDNYIPESNYSVNRNGIPAEMIYSNKEQISYRTQLDPGFNHFEVKVWDEDGYQTTQIYQVLYEVPEETLGTVTVSIEMTTIGMGYLIEDYPIEIKKNTPFSQLLVENFKAMVGEEYEMQYTGTLDSSFYLKSISCTYPFVVPNIPADLEEHLLALNDPDSDEVVYDPEKYDPYVLGEFNICKGSGWMYWVSSYDTYPNHGMDQYYPQDGDVVRIRYTTYYGSDIGGSGAMGNGTNEGEGEGDWGEW